MLLGRGTDCHDNFVIYYTLKITVVDNLLRYRKLIKTALQGGDQSIRLRFDSEKLFVYKESRRSEGVRGQGGEHVTFEGA